ncbi:divalent-cation tolerance protein CutA [bacterium]|nr:divalent-cation tolerance protein CutA [bacterium]MBU1984332.1 divalent-cation tolerance protein CutA [bacterium]
MEPGNGELLLITTLDSEESATGFARGLIESRLAACATVLPGGRSFYRWGDDTVRDDPEVVVLIKTHRSKLSEIERYFREYHPYDCPELIGLDLSAISPAYRDWLQRELM